MDWICGPMGEAKANRPSKTVFLYFHFSWDKRLSQFHHHRDLREKILTSVLLFFCVLPFWTFNLLNQVNIKWTTEGVVVSAVIIIGPFRYSLFCWKMKIITIYWSDIIHLSNYTDHEKEKKQKAKNKTLIAFHVGTYVFFFYLLSI